MTLDRVRAVGVYALVVLVGGVAFGWPFLLARDSSIDAAHAADAWLWVALLAALVVLALTFEIRRGAMRSAHVAVLGVLSAFVALLRLIDLPGGGNALYFVVILAAAAFGPRFGVLLALVSMAASAAVTAGVGPWLPYQMLALAALAVGAGAVGRISARLSPRIELGLLASVGWVSGFVYGALTNLWSWPLIQDGGTLSYAPKLGVVETFERYRSFYVATSFAWDAAGAIANVVLIVALGGPILAALRRVDGRLRPVVEWDAPVAVSGLT
ncbi:MAG: ECF transporter S component [Actinomycetota bacterium]